VKACQSGFGQHVWYLSYEQIQEALRYGYLMAGWGVSSPMFGRVSFCFFMLNISKSERVVRWSLIFCIVTQFLLNVTAIILIYSACGTHIQALWDSRVTAKCLSRLVYLDFTYFQSGQSQSIAKLLVLTLLDSLEFGDGLFLDSPSDSDTQKIANQST
jgi:rhodopsin domain-containing protein